MTNAYNGSRARGITTTALVLSIIGALILGSAATGIITFTAMSVRTEAETVPNDEALEAVVDAIDSTNSETHDYVAVCADNADQLVEALSSANDAYDTSRAAIDDFFTSYDFYAGDVSNLYDQLSATDSDLDFAVTSISLDECDPAAWQ